MAKKISTLKATQAEAEAGLTNSKLMTPLTTKQAIDFQRPPGGSGLTQEQVDDRVAALIVAGTNITKTYDDAAGTLTLAATGGGGGLTQEDVDDRVAALIVAGTNITKTYDDTAGTLTIATTALTQEQVDDRVAALIIAGTNITKTYDDTAGTLTLAATGVLTQEDVDDRVATLIVAGTNITKTYDDTAGTLTLSATGGGGGLTQEDVDDRVATLITAGSGITKSYDDTAGTLTLSSTGGGYTGVTWATATDIAAWDPFATAAPALVFSNSNRIATVNQDYIFMLISSSFKTSGSWHVEMRLNNVENAPDTGLALVGQYGSTGQYYGWDNNAVGFYANGGVYKNGAIVATVAGDPFPDNSVLVAEGVVGGGVKFALNNGAYTSVIPLPSGPIWIGGTVRGVTAQVQLLIAGEFVKTPTSGFSAWIPA